MIGMNHLTNKLLKFYGVFTQYMFLVYYVMCFLLDEDGREYGIGFKTKIVLVFKMFRNIIKIPTASSPLEHLAMTTTILNIPKSIDGVIVECGSYKGGSTSNLSLVCSLVNRQLEVFDSFEGLPEPKNHDKDHILIDIQETHTYAKGAWRGG